MAWFGGLPCDTSGFFELYDVILSDVPCRNPHIEHVTDRSDALAFSGLDQVVVPVPSRLLGRVSDELEDPFSAGVDLPAGACDSWTFLIGHIHISSTRSGWPVRAEYPS
jgi:hypothetical protein